MDGPFDIENAPIAGGYFLGDYEGLTRSTRVQVVLLQDDAKDKDNTYLATISP